MMRRRDLLRSIAVGSIGAASGSALLRANASLPAESNTNAVPSGQHGCNPFWSGWATGVEGQRRADFGDGRFLNPVIPGDHPDPTILKDGDDYYMTFSTFDYYPGIILWHSRDLVNWTPLGPALNKWIGSVFALDLVKHQDRYYIYIPVLTLKTSPDGKFVPTPGIPPLAIYVIHATSIHGPWSDPIDLKIYGAIDPGHVVGDDGKRYLFVNDGRRIRLTDDGLSADGKLEKVYSGWKYPADWAVEGFSLEGPKLLKRDGWFYMFSAEGGTAGPPTSHMVIAARSRSIDGPWENCPHNPIVHTRSAAERWWSRGHATPVKGPDGNWWLMYHGYENGYRTLGRQTLLQPMSWTAEGWPRAIGLNIDGPIAKPGGSKRTTDAGLALSDNFSKDSLGTRLVVFDPDPSYLDQVQIGSGELVVKARGKSPTDCIVLPFIVGDHSYETQVEVELTDTVQAGLLLFYSRRFYAGIGFNSKRGHVYINGSEPLGFGTAPSAIGMRFHLKAVNVENVAKFYFSTDGQSWTLQSSAEVSGYNQNVAGGFLSLRPALYVSGEGEARFRNLRYSADNRGSATQSRH